MENIRKALLIVFAIAALALGGAAIAGAASDGDSPGSATATSSQRADETLLSGNTAAQVRQAALAKVSGATIERVETDADGNAAYEAQSRATARA